VFVVLARRLSDVEPHAERAFLYATAVRVASTRRRSARRRPEEPRPSLDDCASSDLDLEELQELASARGLLDEALDSLPEDLRAAFVLFELEELSVAEVAETLGIPRGTVSWRLSQARLAFERAARRLQAREQFAGGTRGGTPRNG
jgi:RNA polymerase sigma-70 factor (ECF subfamily)